jgi:hypothetical protein
MHRDRLLMVTAVIELAAGFLFLAVPAVAIEALLGAKGIALETLVIGRIAGSALFSIGAACWLGRGDRNTRAQLGLLTGALIYDAAAALLLAYAGLVLGATGIALWPAVALHSGLAVWCVLCLRDGRQ